MANELKNFFFFLLYLLYGLVFFTAGVAVTSKIIRGSKLKIARYLWLFALFAFIHAIHEWLALFLVLDLPMLPSRMLPLIGALKLLPVSLSFIFLLFFGIRVLKSVQPLKFRYLHLLPVLLLALLILLLALHGVEFSPAFFSYADFRMRNLIGFPAALLSGLSLIFYADTIREGSNKTARSFCGAGIALILYGIFTGMIPSGTSLPLLGVPVELLRGIVAFFILHYLMKALHIFDHEREAIIEERLQRFAQSEKLASLGQLAAGIAHEINNPLANVSLNVEMLKKSLFSAGDGAIYENRFAAIERNLERASRIARELLSFSRHDDNREHAVLLDLNELLRNTLTLLGPRRQDYHFELSLNSIPRTRGLPWKIEEVFLNVLMNAMEACPIGRKIAIATHSEENSVMVEITDSGNGIPNEHLHSVFDPFFTTKEVGAGTGLGLSICFGIMERHHGSIAVANQPQGGCTVTLTFPRGDNDGP